MGKTTRSRQIAFWRDLPRDSCAQQTNNARPQRIYSYSSQILTSKSAQNREQSYSLHHQSNHHRWGWRMTASNIMMMAETPGRHWQGEFPRLNVWQHIEPYSDGRVSLPAVYRIICKNCANSNPLFRPPTKSMHWIRFLFRLGRVANDHLMIITQLCHSWMCNVRAQLWVSPL